MKDATKDRVDQVVRTVFAVAGSDICRCCIITHAFNECRDAGLRVSRRDITKRVKALWDQDVIVAEREDDSVPF